MAEAVRFELTNGCPLPVFKTGALNRSATHPESGWVLQNRVVIVEDHASRQRGQD